MQMEADAQKPKHPFEGLAFETLKAVVEYLRQTAPSGKNSCWPWPEFWPPSLGDKPAGVSSVTCPRGSYGQIILDANDSYKRSAFTSAHRLVFQHYNLALDPRHNASEWAALNGDAVENWEGAEWLDGLRPNDQVRHLCNNPPCVNPWHLARGSGAYNDFDKHRKKIEAFEVTSENEIKAKAFVDDFREGDNIPYLAKRHGIKPMWQAVSILHRDKKLPVHFLLQEWKQETEMSPEQN